MLKRLSLLLAAALVAFIVWELVTFPDIAGLENEPPKTTAFMELRKKELRREGKDESLDYRWVSWDQISPNLRRAVIVSEDNSFYEHEGVDTEELKKVLEESWKKKELTRGGSTITQQLAKNLYLSPSRNPWRKVKELILTKVMERELTKKRILEIYLNVVELGTRTYGAEAAAHHYFGKSASGLSMSEAALLAGALPNPRVMNPGSPNARLRARQKIILSRMRRWGSAAEQQILNEDRTETEHPDETAEPTVTDSSSSGTDTMVPDTATTTTEDAVPEPSTVTDSSGPGDPSETPAPLPPPTDTAPPPPPTDTSGTLPPG